MATNYSGRYAKPLGASKEAFGGAGQDLDIAALTGEGDFITTFDDFNGVVKGEGFAGTANWEQVGWVLSEDQGAGGAVTADEVSMNDPVIATNVRDFSSCISIYTGTDDDKGGSMQLDAVNGTVGGGGAVTAAHWFPHLWIPETATIPSGGAFAGAAGDAGEGLDGTTWVFACRVGFRSDWLGAAGAGDWNSKAFIGWAAAGDTTIMDHDTGVITTTNGNLHGFHINETGCIDGISKRITADAMTEGTNWTRMQGVDSVNNTVANGCTVEYATCWYDLALRMDITDMSLDAGNGTTKFYYRRVRPGLPLESWTEHTTQLDNQTPNHTIALVPTIEVINGPTAGRDGGILIDWWAFGRNRPSVS